MGFRGKVWGVLTMLLGIAIVYFTVFQVNALSDLMPDDYLATLFWVGYLVQVLMAILLKPYFIIAKDMEGSPFGVVEGIMSFIFGIIGSLILYYIMDSFFGTSGVLLNDANFSNTLIDIIWFGYVIITFLFIVVVPGFLAWDEPLTEDLQRAMGA